MSKPKAGSLKNKSRVQFLNSCNKKPFKGFVCNFELMEVF